jgi:hypothetical protein
MPHSGSVSIRVLGSFFIRFEAQRFLQKSTQIWDEAARWSNVE